MATQTEINDAIWAGKYLFDHTPTVLQWVFLMLMGLLGLLGIGRKVAMTVSKTSTDLLIDQAVRDQIQLMRDTIHDQAERMEKMGKKLGKLRDIDMAGAGDLAIVGVWVETLETRKCPCLVTNDCCATTSTEKLGSAYKRMQERRALKESVFAEDESTVVEPAPKATRKKKEAAE